MSCVSSFLAWQVKAFWQRNFTGPRVVIAAAGIPHSDLVAFAKDGFESLSSSVPEGQAAKFTTSAMEIRLETGGDQVAAALVSDGAR